MTDHLNDVERLQMENRIYIDLASTLTATLHISEVLDAIMQKVRQLLKPRNWSLLLMEPDGIHLKFEIAVGDGADGIKGSRLKVGEGIAGWVAEAGVSVLIDDVQNDPRFCKRFDEMSCFTTRSIICVPMKHRGKVLGVIELINRIEEGTFSDLDMRALQTLAEFGAIAVNNATLFKTVQNLSLSDEHTSLYNVRFLYDELDRQIAVADERKGSVSLIFLDLDHFKEVNDVHGHLRGSKVLREIGLLIHGSLREGDLAIRYGGDEFVVLMPSCPKEGALAFAGRLREHVNAHHFLTEEGLGLRITASYGVASYPGDATGKTELIGLADAAMYRVKGATRDGIATA